MSLETYGFPSYFMDWIQVLYRDKELGIVNNGHVSYVVYPTNGVVQGCGLSPMLYILVMEILALSIRNNESIRGISLPSFEKKLSMLVDDALLTLKVTRHGFEEVLRTLHDFALLSNLKVNLTKSTLIPLTCCDEISELLFDFPIKWWDGSLFHYLGVWLHPSLTCPNDYFDSLLHKIKVPLQRRNTVYIDMLSCILNVKALVGLQLVYLFALMSSPTCALLDKIQSYVNCYIWNGVHHFRAKFCTNLFEVGGFDMYSVCAQEKSLKLQWVSRYFTDEVEFWKLQLDACFQVPLKVLFKSNLTYTDFMNLRRRI